MSTIVHWCREEFGFEEQEYEFTTDLELIHPGFPATETWNRSALAEKIAERYFRHHDGWECEWPLVFLIRLPDQTVLRYSVGVESVPSFYVERSAAGYGTEVSRGR